MKTVARQDNGKPLQSVEVLQRGERVYLGDGDPIEGIVLAVQIEGRTVSYKVAWWNGRTRMEGWLEDHEVVSIAAGERLRVGFRTP